MLARMTGLPAGIVPTPAPADPLVYVALGDSYTSGPIVLPHDTTFVTQGCGQSSRNYPHIAAALIKADSFRDVSCGGASIDDFSKGQDVVTAVNPPQYNSLNADVDVVTVGIGGNDVNFTGAATDCIQPKPAALGGTPCKPMFVKNGVDTLSQKIAAMGIELGKALDHIHVLAPHAAVFVVGYPDAIPNTGKGCWPYVPILNVDMPYLLAKFKEMNAQLKSTAQGHDSTYVDIYTSSIGHDVCKAPGLAWVNGAVLVPPSFPAHPNDLSFLNSGPIVADAIEAKLHP